MRSRTLQSSTFQLSLLYTVIFAVSVFGPFAFIYDETVSSIDREINASIDAETRSLMTDQERLGGAGLIDVVNERTADPADLDTIYLLADRDKRPLAGNLIEWPRNGVQEARWYLFEIEAIEGGRETSHHIRSRVEVLPGPYFLLVGRDIHERDKVRDTVRRAVGWALALAFGFGIPGGVLMSRRVLRRVDRIAETARQINDGDLSRRMAVGTSGDEFDRLSEGLNVMLDRIDRLMTGMRTVSDSVAHDLRSPLTHLRNRIEQALREAQDTEAYRKALRAALSDTDRVLTMFNALMTVARAEADLGRQEMERIDLGQVADGVVELYEPLVEERGMQIATSIAPDAMVRGHRQLLAQAIANLVDNAIKYSPSGERIALTVTVEEHEVRLSVADSGPGIPVSSRGEALGRFVRLAGGETPGYGLGLSLVAAVAQLHRATLLLEDNTPGLRAVLVFPRA